MNHQQRCLVLTLLGLVAVSCMIGSVNAAESEVSATADEGTFDPSHRIVRAISKRLDAELSKGDRKCGADFVAIGTAIVAWRRHIHANPELGWALTRKPATRLTAQPIES